MDLGQRIKTIRRKLGIEQKDLAEMIGVSTAAVGFWETNKSFPKIPAIIKICEIGSVTTDWLLTGHNLLQESESLSMQERELLEIWGALSEKDKLDAIFCLSRLSRSSNVGKS